MWVFLQLRVHLGLVWLGMGRTVLIHDTARGSHSRMQMVQIGTAAACNVEAPQQSEMIVSMHLQTSVYIPLVDRSSGGAEPSDGDCSKKYSEGYLQVGQLTYKQESQRGKTRAMHMCICFQVRAVTHRGLRKQAS
jgi:hypothetical protein